MLLTRDRVRTKLAVMLDCEDEAVNDELVDYVFELNRDNEILKKKASEIDTKLDDIQKILDSI